MASALEIKNGNSNSSRSRKHAGIINKPLIFSFHSEIQRLLDPVNRATRIFFKGIGKTPHPTSTYVCCVAKRSTISIYAEVVGVEISPPHSSFFLPPTTATTASRHHFWPPLAMPSHAAICPAPCLQGWQRVYTLPGSALSSTSSFNN
jgi:hypothetical protein